MPSDLDRLPAHSPDRPQTPFVAMLAATLFLGATVVPDYGSLKADEPAPQPPRALTVEGEFDGELVACSDDWQLRFEGPEGAVDLPAERLVYWGSLRPINAVPVLVTVDGGLLLADVLELTREQVTADSFILAQVDLPRREVAGVVFQWPATALARDRRIDALLDGTSDDDALVLANGDELRGFVETIGPSSVRVIADLGPVDIQRHRVAAIRFGRKRGDRDRPTDVAKTKTLRAWAGLSDGSRLLVERLTISGEEASLTSGERRFEALAAEDIVFLQPIGGRAVYLSDSEPAGYRHLPYLSIEWPYRLDRNVNGGLLRAAGQMYLKGIGLHSAARITYAVPAGTRQFQAEVAIDAAAGRRGSGGFRTYVDGRAIGQTLTVRGGDEPQPIRVDVQGAKRLDLIVDFADRADQLDYADWLNARWVR